ncbi:hypothetical protein IHE44_0008567 [Lamprotornis superbus]|uniref:Uncharacterized protein n=1 Tax=Lamprotornis superbus TaxID=245042 RepID=A0A835NKZ7_9PASS|nr:hypothetical protein IHE44_0008567 [Lamprotornis superbus]
MRSPHNYPSSHNNHHHYHHHPYHHHRGDKRQVFAPELAGTRRRSLSPTVPYTTPVATKHRPASPHHALIPPAGAPSSPSPGTLAVLCRGRSPFSVLSYIKNKKGREVVIAVGNGRVTSLAEVPWGRFWGSSWKADLMLSPAKDKLSSGKVSRHHDL